MLDDRALQQRERRQRGRGAGGKGSSIPGSSFVYIPYKKKVNNVQAFTVTFAYFIHCTMLSKFWNKISSCSVECSVCGDYVAIDIDRYCEGEYTILCSIIYIVYYNNTCTLLFNGCSALSCHRFLFYWQFAEIVSISVIIYFSPLIMIYVILKVIFNLVSVSLYPSAIN